MSKVNAKSEDVLVEFAIFSTISAVCLSLGVGGENVQDARVQDIQTCVSPHPRFLFESLPHGSEPQHSRGSREPGTAWRVGSENRVNMLGTVRQNCFEM